MGQKIHPTGFRLSVTRNWASRWYAGNGNFAAMLNEDLKARAFLKKKLKNASVGRIVIERPAKNARITIFSARPGVVIGKKGEDIENLKAELTRRLSNDACYRQTFAQAFPETGGRIDMESVGKALAAFQAKRSQVYALEMWRAATESRKRMDQIRKHLASLDKAEVAAGFVLCCQAHPLTERVVLSFDER